MMTSNRPYLVKAIYEWIMDNNVTPHVVINAMDETVSVPQQYVDDGQIILNVNPSAVQDLVIDDECIMFNARFGGKPYNIYAPMHTVMAIYAAENGQGMMFNEEQNSGPPPTSNNDSDKSDGGDSSGGNNRPPRKKPTLRVVK
ncbi:MAG: ClpXP protease specificity-enhancing factor [Cocleimonas sp.]|nr:ClpXP protease specificity-enhancing factor [Cocleimonas sp.]